MNLEFGKPASPLASQEISRSCMLVMVLGETYSLVSIRVLEFFRLLDHQRTFPLSAMPIRLRSSVYDVEGKLIGSANEVKFGAKHLPQQNMTC